MSSGCGLLRSLLEAGIKRTASTVANTPIGTFTKKIQRQLALSMSRPPIVGPMIGASIVGTPVTAMTRPMREGPAAPARII